MFANMKIGLRLTLGFVIVLVLMAALAFVGINGMTNVQGRLDGIVNDDMVKIKLNSELSEAVHIAVRLTRTMILVDDPAASAGEKRKLDAIRQKYNETWDALEKLPASDKGKALRAKIKAAATEARGGTDKVVELALANKDPEAVKVLLEEAAPAAQKWQDAIDDNVAFRMLAPRMTMPLRLPRTSLPAG